MYYIIICDNFKCLYYIIVRYLTDILIKYLTTTIGMATSKEKYILAVDNIDELLPKTRKKYKTIHPDLIPALSRIVIIGSSGSGKTNFLVNMLIKPQILYEKVFMYSKNLHQEKYSFLKSEINNTENLINSKRKKGTPSHKIIEKWTNDIDEMLSLDELESHKDTLNILIIDDFPILTKQQQLHISKIYSMARHFNTTVIYLQQLYFQLPRGVRLNLTHIVLFQNKNKREKTLLAQELSSDLENGQQFSRIYETTLDKKYKFLLIDNTTDDPQRRYRDGYSKSAYGYRF